eukprot:3276211-Heterocapsa_arctica.AAC.1
MRSAQRRSAVSRRPRCSLRACATSRCSNAARWNACRTLPPSSTRPRRSARRRRVSAIGRIKPSGSRSGD